jgi:hypothetical protein
MIAADLRNVQAWVVTTPVDMRKSFNGRTSLLVRRNLDLGGAETFFFDNLALKDRTIRPQFSHRRGRFGLIFRSFAGVLLDEIDRALEPLQLGFESC